MLKISRTRLIYHAKQMVKTGLQSNGIQAVPCYKVDMGNIV
jgi:hypothetical protein